MGDPTLRVTSLAIKAVTGTFTSTVKVTVFPDPSRAEAVTVAVPPPTAL
jgi:hypothetical protein